MTTVARRDPADKAKIDAIEEKLLANPEIAKLIDELGTSTTDANDLVRGMLQASISRGLHAEMDAHLGYGSGDRQAKAAAGTGNHRNGTYPKTVDSNYGPVTVDIPRDRAGTFIPTMVPKGSRRLTDVDDMIVSLYAGGMTIRDIQHHMATAMGVDISHETISAVTDAVLDEVLVWQNRQLDEFYPVIFLDALRIKVRDGGRVVNKSAYMAIGVDIDGIKHILGLWIAKEEGASFWAHVCSNLSNRGVKDVFIVCCDGLKGLPEAVEATWPGSMVQTLSGAPYSCRQPVGCVRGSQGKYQRRSRRCTPLQMSPVLLQPWQNSRYLSLVRSIPGQSRSGRTPGSGLSRSYNSLRQPGRLSTPQTLSSRLTMSCVKPPVIGFSSPTMNLR